MMLSRPWSADPYLKSLVVEMLEKSHSVTKLITFKPAVKDLYNSFRKQCPDPLGLAAKLSDLAHAPQRYSSEAQTLMRGS